MGVSRAGWALAVLTTSTLVTACSDNTDGGGPVPAAPVTSDIAATTTATTTPRSTTTTTTAPTTTHVAAQVAEYAGTQTGTYYFASPSAKFECAIATVGTPVAGCHGTFPPDAPRVPGAGAPRTTVAPNAVRVTSDRAGEFVHLGDPAFHRFDGPARVLPYGNTLDIQGFTCSVDERAGVTCGSGSGHGFTVSDSAYKLW
ncbi:hypothetical protein [Rhodococcus kronopolitis]|uniref:Lipoprotein n=1 Tax=Rhodococcus kronopolitis TaxID=1460226 RepID=A0ABV9FYT0_9NOCA